ncbi:CBP80/20-dependent translation initiation factor-like isoform X2 [Babylonia areolata]|uniref:CBP80/20-dependent translation initiation factor-like isoform X2 n=1 Tax=Babylonia areolata TaxID=304850 RepID=UPI003FD53EFE
MAGRGRGRGRGLVINKPHTPGGGDESEPKVESRPKLALSDMKKEVVTILQDRCGEPAEEDMQRIEQLVSVVGDVQEVAKALYAVVREKRDWVKGVAVICERLSTMEPDGTQFRSAILRLVQEDYKDRERLKTAANDHFLSCVGLLSHLFVTMRLANGEVLQALIDPIFNCLELIMLGTTITDSEADVVNGVLLLIGRELQDNSDDRMQELMIYVRTKIIEQETLPAVRCYLLEVLESFARRWQVAPNDVTRFYLDINAEIYAGLAVDHS